ncbi:SpoIIE family protein phosphatase [Oligoflexus sp.]|uniref:SpoIIE family protein phosphatase n=1 Tax=Oligoflexus sp. TaxID=1971216 RepID=UPI002D78E97B|nr:SpoIIE family protein phosphatase [Oligoflexus sp.]
MQEQTKNTSNSQHGQNSQRLFVLVWLFWVLILQLIGPSAVHDSIQTYAADPVLFRVRDKLGKTPELSPRLKILALDDGTIDFLKKPELSVHDLSLLLGNIAKKKPRAIILDKVFSLMPEKTNEEDLERLRQIKDAPVYTGSFINQAAIKLRSPLELEEDKYGPTRWLKPGADWEDVLRHMRSSKDVKDTSGFIYAYEKAFQGAFTGVGHIRINTNGSVMPFILYQTHYLLPHLALYAADSIEVGKNLEINGQKVPLRENGSVYVNHRPLPLFYDVAHMRSLQHAIKRAREDRTESWIQEDDVVLILFDFYTGATNFIEGAPFGELPNGILVSTLVDSVVANRWLTPMGSLPWLIILGTILGTAIARYTGPMQYWAFLLIVAALWFTLVNYLFSYHSIIVPWVMPLIGLLGGGIIQYIYNRLGSEWRVMEVENQYLQERARRLEEEKAKVQFAERLNLGRAVQEILLPSQMEQTFHPFGISMSYQPAQEMSGDWIYLWEAGDTERRIFLGDVVGKGPSAAIPVAVIIGILGECQGLGMSIQETLQRLNRRLLELFDKQISSSVTAIALHQDGHVEIHNAGSPGWFLRESGQSRYISLRSSALGVTEDNVISHEELRPAADSILFAFTDGYMEGSRAFKRLIQRLDQMPSEPMTIDVLQSTLDEVGKDFRLEDDRSLLLINCKAS